MRARAVARLIGGATAHARRAAGIAAAGMLALGLAGCAAPAPPGGGPLDLSPPRILMASPDSGAVNVPRNATLQVAFDKSMDHGSVEDYIFTAPPIRVGEVRWKGRVMQFVPRDSLLENTTYLAVIGTGARDVHGNALAGARNLLFSTGPRLRQGRVSGRVDVVKQGASGLFVWLYEDALHADSSWGRAEPDLVGQTGSEGRFEILGLRLDRSYSLHVFADANHNRTFDPDREFMLHADHRVRLTDSLPSDTSFALHYVDPKLPGSIAGRLDTVLVARRAAVRAEGVTDSLLSQTASPDARGGFLLRLAPPGRYRVYWFEDPNGNQLPDPGEARGEALELSLSPGEDLVDLAVPATGPPRRAAKITREQP